MIQILNESTYLELKSLMEQEFDLLLRTFYESSAASIAAIRTALGQNDFEQLRLSAHTLKGSSACLGAERLAQLCRVLEGAAIRHDVEKLQEMLVELEGTYTAVVARLKKHP